MKKFFILLTLLVLGAPLLRADDIVSYEMVGEVTERTAILQSRLVTHEKNWKAHFEIATNPEFTGSFKTEEKEAESKYDFVVKFKIKELIPNTTYYYRITWFHKEKAFPKNPQSFKTLPGLLINQEVSFVAGGCMNYAYFHRGRYGFGRGAYKGADKKLGYPAFKKINELKPDYFVGLGDNVYYDPILSRRAKTPEQMRMRWHEQFSLPRLTELFSSVGTYWLMDDHDFRFDNGNPGIDKKPTREEGIDIFTEQLPVWGPDDEKIFYHTLRINSSLQVWFLDNRTLRDANQDIDGPEKSIWGEEQLKWLKETLIASDAKFKIIFSSTPIIGPDKLPTVDNHTVGFKYERTIFLDWLVENKLKNLYFVVADAHWKYHSKLLGFEEFSSGSIDTSNALVGVKPGDEHSSDPEATVDQPYKDSQPQGGFLHIVSKPDELKFTFYNSKGNELYSEKYGL